MTERRTVHKTTTASWRLPAASPWTRRLLAVVLFGALAGSPAFAQAQSGAYGDWTFGIDTELTAASTTAADGSTFGMVCRENCLTYIESGRSCREGAFYMGRVESRLGAFEVQWRCRHLGERFVLTATPTEDLITVIAQCSEISFSVALEDGNPNVFRFSLGGAYEAISTVLEAAIAISERLQAARTGLVR